MDIGSDSAYVSLYDASHVLLDKASMDIGGQRLNQVSGPFTLGRSWWGGAPVLDAIFDDVNIYNYSRKESPLSALKDNMGETIPAHFTLEQVGRNSKGHFINFNGTAGIWRKECILDAGNWEGDTLTEDLDLSYRAQLKNWKFKYLVDVETPAELPLVISAARSQQFRWNKGGAENFQKFMWRVLKDDKLPLKTKIHGLLHLLNSTMFLNILIVCLL